MGKTLGQSFAVAVAVLISMPANANLLGLCDFPPKLVFSPAGPGPNDTVYAGLDFAEMGAFSGKRYVRSRVSAGEVDVDIVYSIASDPSFLLSSGFADTTPFLSYGVANLGILAVGTYVATLTVGMYDGSGNGQTITPFCKGTYTQSFVVFPQSTPVLTAKVIEYYNPLIDHYFMTQYTQEISALDGGLFNGWVRTGQTFLAYVTGQSDNRGRWVCRWYTTLVNRATHFFSASADECAVLIHGYGGVWQQEAPNAFEIALPSPSGICPQNTVPVYRLWNNRIDSDHRYTTDAATRNAMVAAGYIAEGYGPDAIAMCAPSQ